MNIGILALQGAFREHEQIFVKLGVVVRQVRLPAELKGLAGLVIPGGESTTMAKLIQSYGFDKAIPEFYQAGGAIWGTCAGAILIARNIVNQSQQFSLNLLDISVERNAYGRQIASFETQILIRDLVNPFPAVFIRAPRIIKVGYKVEILAFLKQDPVMVKQGRLMATVFHPELNEDNSVHNYFLEQIEKIS